MPTLVYFHSNQNDSNQLISETEAIDMLWCLFAITEFLNSNFMFAPFYLPIFGFFTNLNGHLSHIFI